MLMTALYSSGGNGASVRARNRVLLRRPNLGAPTREAKLFCPAQPKRCELQSAAVQKQRSASRRFRVRGRPQNFACGHSPIFFQCVWHFGFSRGPTHWLHRLQLPFPSGHSSSLGQLTEDVRNFAQPIVLGTCISTCNRLHSQSPA